MLQYELIQRQINKVQFRIIVKRKKLVPPTAPTSGKQDVTMAEKLVICIRVQTPEDFTAGLRLQAKSRAKSQNNRITDPVLPVT